MMDGTVSNRERDRAIDFLWDKLLQTSPGILNSSVFHSDKMIIDIQLCLVNMHGMKDLSNNVSSNSFR